MFVPAVLLLSAQGLVQGPWSDQTAPPETRAAALVKEMTLIEKLAMLHGPSEGPAAQCNTSAACAYVGNVAPNARLGIPPITMNDGPQGFRDNNHPGTTTAWPSGLTMAASWDTDAMHEWGTGMGKEFFAKGANVQLGPGLCLARVPRNGRNFEYASYPLPPPDHRPAATAQHRPAQLWTLRDKTQIPKISVLPPVSPCPTIKVGAPPLPLARAIHPRYLSGEDPILGYYLVRPVIKGIQSQKVVANAKHWVMNNEETNRHGVSADVDERTRFEMYYPPFAGAIEAGVGSLMCSYNKINSKWSCENPETLVPATSTSLTHH